ncbi:MAG: NERD domain-containing protein [Candidatus Saccharibacteria bacterium]|nr:NERD domain-containing protein [Rhodoferax sp.]
MALKSVDDKSKRLGLLEELQLSTALDQNQKKWLREELMRIKKGIRGERESAHYLDHYFKDAENHVLLHDLRFLIDGDVTQIDHLILGRTGSVYLLETKNYACNLVINERGEFTAEYENARFGIASPIEQGLRHEKVLHKLFEQLGIVGRTQKHPDFHHVVMLHPKATIERPSTKSFDTANVIKADQFPTWHKSFVDKFGVGMVFKSALNVRSLETITEWGEKLKRQHRPADLLALPDFMQPRELTKVAVLASPLSRPALQPGAPAPARSQAPALAPLVAAGLPSESAKRLVCARCAVKISFAEGKFCWNNAQRFGGLAYCREHQASMRVTPG